jgi:GWxTD domain-containing protein
VRPRPFVVRALLAMLATSALPALAKEDPLRAWLDGPVHYIMAPEEIRAYKALRSDPERAAFIERFWRRRDPSPNTLVNEYRQLFWQRVKDADEKFVDRPGPGWKTDRGKIYILYGPPDDIDDDPTARTRSETDSGAGLIRWTYRGRAGSRRDLDPDVIVPFVRDVSGEYRVSSDPELASPFFNSFQVADKNTAGLSSFLAQRPTSRDPLGVMLDLGKLQEVPPEEDVILGGVETFESFAYEPLPLEIDRFLDPAGDLVAVVTVSIPGPPGSEPPTMLARFSHPGSKEASRILSEGSFRVEGEGDLRHAQGRVALSSGSWDVVVLAVDPASGANRIYRGRLEPLPAGPLGLSDIVLARSMEPLPYAFQASYTDPYIVGGFRVTPRISASVPRGEAVRLFFEIDRGVAPYHLSYQMEGQENDGRWRALGNAQERQAETRGQGFELPTGPEWPLGSYRVRITVTDAAGHSAERVAAFAVAPK